MAPSNVTYQKVAIKYGIFVGIAHILYFLLMDLLNLLEVIEFSFLSGVFLVIGIVVALSRYKAAKRGVIQYFHGLGVGATVGVISSVVLAIFLAIYISFIDATYLKSLQASYLFPESLSLLSLFALTIVYGAWTGFWLGFILMQWFKGPNHTSTEKVN